MAPEAMEFIARDGDCFFEAAVRSGTCRFRTATELRKAVCAWFAENPEHFSEHFKKGVYKRQITQMCKPGVWNRQLGDYVPTAFVYVAGVSVVVVQDAVSVFEMAAEPWIDAATGELFEPPVLRLARIDDCHYEILADTGKCADS